MCLRQSHLAVLLNPVRLKTRSYLEALSLQLPCDNLGFLAFLGAVSPLGCPGKLKPGVERHFKRPKHAQSGHSDFHSNCLNQYAKKSSVQIFCTVLPMIVPKSQHLACICHFSTLQLQAPEDLLECTGCRGCGMLNRLNGCIQMMSNFRILPSTAKQASNGQSWPRSVPA